MKSVGVALFSQNSHWLKPFYQKPFQWGLKTTADRKKNPHSNFKSLPVSWKLFSTTVSYCSSLCIQRYKQLIVFWAKYCQYLHNTFMLWRYWLYWACLRDVFGSKVKLFLHLVSKKCFDCKGQKSSCQFLKMQVLLIRGTSELEPFFLVAKWELLLLTGKRNRSWKQNYEEVLCAFELIFPFTLCLYLYFILWKYFTILLFLP